MGIYRQLIEIYFRKQMKYLNFRFRTIQVGES